MIWSLKTNIFYCRCACVINWLWVSTHSFWGLKSPLTATMTKFGLIFWQKSLEMTDVIKNCLPSLKNFYHYQKSTSKNLNTVQTSNTKSNFTALHYYIKIRTTEVKLTGRFCWLNENSNFANKPVDVLSSLITSI